MKYIKTYEGLNNNDEPQIGDYVICKDSLFDEDSPSDKEMIDFLSNNIGQYVVTNQTYSKHKYTIKYTDIPFNIQRYFDPEDKYIATSDSERCIRGMKRDEIIFYSEDKLGCEAFFASNKYNL